MSAPFEMQHVLGRPGREPDILFVAQTHVDRLTPKRLEGPADVVMEVVSKSSVTRDYKNKYAEYEWAGVPEYWIIDPRPGKQSLHLYQLSPYGKYVKTMPDGTGRYHSAVLAGFWVRAEWLWSYPFPDADWIIEEIIPHPGLTSDERQFLLERNYTKMFAFREAQAEARGHAKGEIQGRMEGATHKQREIARRMLDAAMDRAMVMRMTGLSAEELAQLERGEHG